MEDLFTEVLHTYIHTHTLRIEAIELEGLEECGLFKKETWEVLSLYFTVEEAVFHVGLLLFGHFRENKGR